MSKKKQRNQPQPRQQEFRSDLFAGLKGVRLPDAAPAVAKPPLPVPAPVVTEDPGSDLFLRAMDGVRRLDECDGAHRTDDKNADKPGRAAPRKVLPQPAPPVDPAATDLFMQEIRRLKLEVKFTEQLSDEDELKPLSGNRLKQLKRGIVTVDYQIDLHGLTRDEALVELPRFLRSARQRGQAAALVITGKGNHSQQEPVLQQAVAAWFRDAGRDLVLEYAPAPRELGGSGAFVVFLRPASKPDSKPS